MKRLPEQEEEQLDPTVNRIWEDIVYSMDQYTNDSALSKFYLPEDILIHCRTAANIFTQLLYTPIPTKEQVSKSRAYGLLYLAMTCGVQIFLKERIMTKGYVPYKIVIDDDIIRTSRNKVGRILSEGIKVQSPVSQVMELFIEELTREHYTKRMTIRNHEFNAEKFDNLLPAAIMWGYLLTQELLVDENLD